MYNSRLSINNSSFRSPQRSSIKLSRTDQLLARRNMVLRNKNKAKAEKKHKGIFKICFIFTLKSRLKMLECFQVIKKLMQYHMASLKNRQLFHIPLDKLRTFTKKKRRQAIFLIFLFSKMAEKMRFCLINLRTKLRYEKEQKQDKIKRCWYLMKNIGAKRIYKIYLRRHGIEKLEKHFFKWKREARFREIFGKNQQAFAKSKRPIAKLYSQILDQENFDILEDESDDDSGVLQNENYFSEEQYASKKSGDSVLEKGLGALMLQNLTGGGASAHEDYVDKIIKDHKRKTAHLTKTQYKFNPQMMNRIRDIRLTRGEVCGIIKENVVKLKSTNKDILQDAVDFGDYETFVNTFVDMTIEFYAGVKTHSEIAKNKKMKKKERQLRKAMYKPGGEREKLKSSILAFQDAGFTGLSGLIHK